MTAYGASHKDREKEQQPKPTSDPAQPRGPGDSPTPASDEPQPLEGEESAAPGSSPDKPLFIQREAQFPGRSRGVEELLIEQLGGPEEIRQAIATQAAALVEIVTLTGSLYRYEGKCKKCGWHSLQFEQAQATDMVKNHAIKHWRELMAEKLGTAFGAEPLRNYPPAQAEAMPAPAAGQAQSDVAKQQPPIGH